MPTTGTTTYVESPTDGRLYEVVTINGFPVDNGGRECECVFIEDEQRIELSCMVGGPRRSELVADVLGCPRQSVAWRLVPVLGRTRPGPVTA